MSRAQKTLGEAKIVGRLPTTGGCDSVPSGLIGAVIASIGTLKDQSAVEGGGLVIDFIPAGKSEVERVVFAFNEMGMWITWPERK
jgi:hypothetical protein